MDRISFCFILIFVALSVPAFADNDLMSNKTSSGPGYGVGNLVQQTTDGGYIIVGTKYSYDPKLLSQMVWLIKTDANGNQIWNKTFGGPRSDWGRSVQQTTDGGYIIAGSMYSYNAAHLSQMVWLIKTDANGNLIWDRIFGGPRDDWGNYVQQTNDGGYIITGATKSYGEDSNSALWVIKTDDNGNEVWDRTFSGPGDAVGYSVQQTSDYGYIIAGSKLPYGKNTGELWLIKTDANGNQVWDKSLDGSADDQGKSVQQTNNGGYIITGSRASSSGGTQDVWLIKTDASGNEVWDRAFDGSGWNEGKSVQQTDDDGYILTGSAFSYRNGGMNTAVRLIKTDTNGNEVWDRTFGE